MCRQRAKEQRHGVSMNTSEHAGVHNLSKSDNLTFGTKGRSHCPTMVGQSVHGQMVF